MSDEKHLGKIDGGSGDHAPVLSLDERRRAALKEVDTAKFSWFHIKVCVIAGVGFFTDAYDIFAVEYPFL
jgi:MFS transporter, PHS family, inorganic phosphate transporter